MRGIFNELAEEHGFKRMEPGDFERLRDLHGIASLRELGLPLWKLPAVMTGMRRRMEDYTGTFSLFPGIAEVLRRLASSNIKLAVVSSNSLANVQRVLGVENTKLFEEFACGVSMFGKASRLRQVVRRGGVPRAQVMYIGDEIRDGEAAAKAGVAFGAVTWGQHREKALRLRNPALVFKEPREIADILCGS